MQRILLSLLLIVISVGKTFSQCSAETTEPKVLLIGDSWAWFMHTDGTFNNVFKTWGFSNFTYISNSVLSENGAETDDFIKPSKQTEIQNKLVQYPSIEVVHLSIGGNDFLGDWNVNMTQAETDTLAAHVMVRLDSIIRFIKQCKPGIKILWSGYCYTNFKEIITNFAVPSVHPFYNTWHGMGDPDFIQINSLQNDISDQMLVYCDTTPDVYYVNSNSILQYEYGQTSPLQGGLAPTGTYAPHTAPIPYGFPDFPSPRNSMRDYAGITKDCFHLSAEGYRIMIGYHMQKFYHKVLMDDLYLLPDSAQSGTVSSQGNVSNSFEIGEQSGEQLATLLSFNTTAMADTALVKASIFLRRKTLTGTNPVTANSFVVKVKNGNFGTSANVEAVDFSDAGHASEAVCNFGSYGSNNDWVRIDLPSAILAYINNSAPTQFIITAPNASGGKVEYYDSSDPDFAPVLNLKYVAAPSGIEEAAQLHFNVYPNPTNGLLTIEPNGEIITHIEVLNLLGETIIV